MHRKAWQLAFVQQYEQHQEQIDELMNRFSARRKKNKTKGNNRILTSFGIRIL